MSSARTVDRCVPVAQIPGMNGDVPPIVSVIGRKNSGKTTLLVQLAAVLKGRGLRVASIKHSHHDIGIDRPGKDSWRHFHEGGVEAVVLASPRRVSVIVRTDEDEHDPVELAREFLSGRAYDIILVESFRNASLSKLEIYRQSAHETPLWAEMDEAERASFIGMVTDAPGAVETPFPQIELQADASHVAAAAELVLDVVRAAGAGTDRAQG